MNDILDALWLFIPAAIANATPVVASRTPLLKRWKTPMDFGKSYQGKRVLGNNKTWRGVAAGVVIGGLSGYLQHRLRPGDMDGFIQVLFAISISFGALYGDAIESFFKRQAGVKAGQSWFPFDQIDYILGALVAAIPYQLFGLEAVTAIIGVYFVAHLITVFVFYHLGIREQPI